MVIQGGTIINYDGRMTGDIRIEGEKITAIEKQITPHKGEEVISACGKYVLPGGIDAHTHFDMPAGACMTSDDFYTGTRAAIAGGTTTIIDFAEPDEGEALIQGLNIWNEKAEGKSYCDYSFHMTVSGWDDTMQEQIKEMTAQGITSFKCYTAYKDSIGVEDHQLEQIMQAVKQRGGVLCIHCEDGFALDQLQKQLWKENKKDIRNHARSRPDKVEAEAIRKVIHMAEQYGTKIYIVHISTKKGLDEAVHAKAEELNIYAETCPHYLLLDDSKYNLPGFEGAKYVMSPPLRGRENKRALWEGIKAGSIDTVSTDHCSFRYEGQKELGREDFTKIPNGIPSAEQRLCLMHHFGEEHGLSSERIVELTSYKPAEIFGLLPRKGQLRAGSDADIIIMDKTAPYKIRAEQQMQDVDYTPYEGIEVTWKVDAVFLRGRKIAEQGKILEQIPGGKFQFRRPDGPEGG